jgi:hypothetical protein
MFLQDHKICHYEVEPEQSLCDGGMYRLHNFLSSYSNEPNYPMCSPEVGMEQPGILEHLLMWHRSRHQQEYVFPLFGRQARIDESTLTKQTIQKVRMALLSMVVVNHILGFHSS